MHIGVIIDGNRRWAAAHGKATHEGYRVGCERVLDLIQLCQARGIDYLSVFLLAQRNIQERDHAELENIYAAMREVLLPRLRPLASACRFHLAGDLTLLPDAVADAFLDLEKCSRHGNAGMGVLLALGYGGQTEIVRGMRRLVHSGADLANIDEAAFSRNLDSGIFPPPDLLIRTGGTQRLSGFLLFQAEYSELYFTTKLWPEFGADDFEAALAFYRGAQRNFGK